MGKGFLTGKIDKNTVFDSADNRTASPRFNMENREANQVLVDLISRMAAEKNASPAQVALAWVLAQKPWIVPIPGTRKLERLEENIGAAEVKLSPEELSSLDSALSKIKISGDRYPTVISNKLGK
ncbi:aldo/keto reductase [Paenibacillus lupini]